MVAVPITDPAGLAAGAASLPLVDASGGLDAPLLAVDLRQGAVPGHVLDGAIERARDGDRLLVGVTGRADLPPATRALAEALDLTLCEGDAQDAPLVPVPDAEAALAGVAAAVSAHPQAALVLARLLRITPALPVRAALDAESFAYSTLLGGAEFARWLHAREPRSEAPPLPDPVLLARDGDRLTVTLNLPARRNALGRRLRAALIEALDVALLDDTVKRVLVEGAGPVFSSGGDLAEFGTAPDPSTAHLVRTSASPGLLVHRLGERAEVRMQGACAGAGVEIPAFAATVRAAPGTTFRLPEIGMGLVPGAGGTVSIPRRIGRWRTLHLALTGAPLDTPTALAWGLIDAIA
ncbi:enoyl-CoA hydratase/isomerase family protein [Actinomadura sp. KC216]|uniref:enoyl-CoA hydratase/isomerase family protein n=1 Tax=Actinomadura sp. KC216 TaxID=2530370 RepID=UPI001045347C|nr:enoyl-CoA hydratase/isomerase family protein [Actinomadura sp. KC216]TDB85183.1 enoyl-CoA hydratase/isomerase family protein [Actinomadura sp. KC216]